MKLVLSGAASPQYAPSVCTRSRRPSRSRRRQSYCSKLESVVFMRLIRSRQSFSVRLSQSYFQRLTAAKLILLKYVLWLWLRAEQLFTHSVQSYAETLKNTKSSERFTVEKRNKMSIILLNKRNTEHSGVIRRKRNKKSHGVDRDSNPCH